MKISDYLKVVFCVGICCFSISGLADSVSNGNQHLTEIACRYETKVTPQGKTKTSSNNNAWFFWRKSNMIQTRDADGDHGEIWERLTDGGIQYRKLYHADKTAVEYMPADMTTNNMSFDWFKLSSMLSQQELEDLKLIKKTKILGRRAELRKGKKDGQTIEVLWLVNEELPASIIRKDQSGSVELRLVEISTLSNAPWKPVDTEEIANYRHIDAVDFGDMENDPFVKKVMAAEGHHH
ncbi:hypothetical protein [Methylobacter tundripaludum]|uniref:Outer membrane lipoprotein-sorting protein n=1 Tax=Methylobacter tundripaludum (strain ATCC BAA-1195 / DSM 17260 / SV96) TaxID=697282 RepID=G3IY60_METTV|nr:hypothetical protein [Methylobacter tundripaludum]EGW19982.1 hypothetical protein Mettu_3105 [Methylobacter tundripaludum SV96]